MFCFVFVFCCCYYYRGNDVNNSNKPDGGVVGGDRCTFQTKVHGTLCGQSELYVFILNLYIHLYCVRENVADHEVYKSRLLC